ncbi:MAG: ribonuclease Y [Acidobacteriota bacterium]
MLQEYLIFGAIAAGAIVIWIVVRLRVVDRKLQEAAREAEEMAQSARQDADRIKKEKLLEGKDEIFKWRVEAEKEIQEQRKKVMELERRVAESEQRQHRELRRAERKRREVDLRLRNLRRRETQLTETEAELQKLMDERTRQLEMVAGLTAEEAKKSLMQAIEADAMRDAAMLAKRLEEEARERSEIEARKIISQAIQRCAAEHVVESSVSVVDLPSEEMKGRIIGREGRNIRALEQATGVDLIVDDTPEAVILSAFDPLRREIARVSIERLIRDGRIHPARIEEVVSKVESEFDKQLKEEGEQVSFELGIHNFSEGLLQLLGRLRYRTSYGQNVLNHSRDVAYLAGIMAREIGANVEVCKRAGLLHDIGKAVDRNMEGTHLQLGVEIARRYGENEEVIHAIEAHHFDVEFRSAEAVLVQAADAISAARPGARREVLESYVRRLEKLEELAGSFDGVTKAFALQAGREIRVLVESSKVTDDQAFWLSKDIAKRIEKELEYPGQIKVTLIREMRVVDYAR